MLRLSHYQIIFGIIGALAAALLNQISNSRLLDAVSIGLAVGSLVSLLMGLIRNATVDEVEKRLDGINRIIERERKRQSARKKRQRNLIR